MPVVVAAVRSHTLFRTSAVHYAVTCHVVVIADVFETTVTDMIRAARFKTEALAIRCGRAVDYYKCYCYPLAELI